MHAHPRVPDDGIVYSESNGAGIIMLTERPTSDLNLTLKQAGMWSNKYLSYRTVQFWS